MKYTLLAASLVSGAMSLTSELTTLVPPTTIPFTTTSSSLTTLIPPTTIPFTTSSSTSLMTLIPPTTIPFPQNGTTLPPPTTIPFPTNGTTTSTIEYFDTVCGCTKTSTYAGIPLPTPAPPTTTLINGVPCTIAAAPGGGVVLNGQTITPGSAPTTVAGQPVAYVPGASGPALQVGGQMVPVPGSSTTTSGSTVPNYVSGGSSPANTPSMYTGGAAANVASGAVGPLAALLALFML